MNYSIDRAGFAFSNPNSAQRRPCRRLILDKKTSNTKHFPAFVAADRSARRHEPRAPAAIDASLHQCGRRILGKTTEPPALPFFSLCPYNRKMMKRGGALDPGYRHWILR
jgi:hypothetical protein